ncbi:MAG: HEPN domain-containing protein [Candidatus Omnitrophica bacterium]|nr:HEPN domain-containing protein [Candidatus Omnitrophota bacterium]
MTKTNKISESNKNWYILIAGFPRPTKPLTLTPGITLVPIKSPITVFDLASAGAVGFHGWSVLEPIAPALTVEIESAKDSDILPGYDTLNCAWLASTLLVLKGYTRHICVACSSYTWNYIAGHQPKSAESFRKQIKAEGVESAVFRPKKDLPSFEGNLLDFHLEILTHSNAKVGMPSEEDISWIRKYYNTFNRLASESESFRFALEAATDWRFAKDARSAVSRLWSGIEAIFGITSELIYRISLISACLLSPRGPLRREKFDEIKNLYSLRSKVVHGEKLSEENISKALSKSFVLLSDLLIYTITKGHVLNKNDFDEAIFH